ncbi:D-glycero-beta-D-manno-heptose-7-phosphate kinase [Candidatus Fermentibacteria bacterium]|nr:MAG: D-glycero-beta-D-manno-heptose-7-phosphate kinase [Candidatus Fermentibacteria bacterium]
MIPDTDTSQLIRMFEDRKILVAGDLVLDHYLEGKVSRISPEAPVPVVSLGENSERWIPGGAANVALNVVSLGGIPVMAGAVGDDSNGRRLINLLQAAGVDVSAVVTDTERPTTVKTRIMSRNQQLMRVDRERTSPLGEKAATELTAKLAGAVRSSDSVILEDYNKGVLSLETISFVMKSAAKSDIPVAVDPKIENFWKYRGASLFKPNRHEAGRALGIRIADPETAAEAAGAVMNKLQAKAVLITLGSGGSVLVQEDGSEPCHIPTVARHVFDVSGAGDSVIAVMGLGLSCGMNLHDSARLANLAAAAVCAEPGVYAVKAEDIAREAGRFE